MGRRYGILTALSRAEKPVSVVEMSKALSLSEQAVALWCEAAYSTGLIRKEATRYFLPRRLVPLLVDEDSVQFVGGLPSYLALRSLDFGSFDQLFRNGGVAKSLANMGDAFREGTVWDHAAFIRLILPNETELRHSLEVGARVLDVGAGSGGWSIKLAGRYPKSKFLGIDPDSRAIAKARSNAAEHGLKNAKFSVRSAEEIGQSGVFDVAYLGEVLYLMQERRKILQSCHAALRKGGVLVVCEGLIGGGSGAHRLENQLVQSMQLDFALQGGRFFTKKELARLLQSVAFDSVRFHDVGGGLWFAVALKQ